MPDFSDAGPQMELGALIPDGSFCKLILAIRPGGFTLPNQDAADNALFKASDSSDAVMLDCELTVQGGQYDKRKLWEFLTVQGGKLDERGQSKGWLMTKSRIRAMLESAMNVDPKDESPRAKQARIVPSFKSLDGCPFYAKIGIEEGSAYTDRQTGQQKMGRDKNTIARIVTPSDEEYAALAAGKEVPPKPSRAPHVGHAPMVVAASPSQPAWARSGGTPPTPAPATALPPNSAVAQVAPATPAAPSGPAWLRQ